MGVLWSDRAKLQTFHLALFSFQSTSGLTESSETFEGDPCPLFKMLSFFVSPPPTSTVVHCGTIFFWGKEGIVGS